MSTDGRSKAIPEHEEQDRLANYSSLRAKCHDIMRTIADLRTIQALARVAPLEQRQRALDRFQTNYSELKGCLDKIKAQISGFSLGHSGRKNRVADQTANKSTAALAAPSETEDSLVSRLTTQAKSIQTNYRQLFVEGSLKRLGQVCKLTQLENDLLLDYDIEGWHEQLMRLLRFKEVKCCECL